MVIAYIDVRGIVPSAVNGLNQSFATTIGVLQPWQMRCQLFVNLCDDLIAKVMLRGVVLSLHIEAPTQEAGAARTFGGGNETLGGMQRIIGSEPSSFTAVLRGVPQASVIIPLKELMCEADAGNLGVYLFDENGFVEAIQDPSVATTFYPIPIRAFFVGDKVHGGLEAPDNNTISWQFAPNYSDHLTIVKPTDFNPLTDF